MKQLILAVLVSMMLYSTGASSQVSPDFKWRECLSTSSITENCAMTAREKGQACELGAEAQDFTNEDEAKRPDGGIEYQRGFQRRRQAFVKQCTTNKKCDPVASWFAQQDQRRQVATHVDFAAPQPIEDILKAYPFLKKDFSPGVKVIVGESPAISVIGFSFLFVLSPDPANQHQGVGLHIYADDGIGIGYGRISYDGPDPNDISVSRPPNQISLFFGHPWRRAPASTEYIMMRGGRFVSANRFTVSQYYSLDKTIFATCAMSDLAHWSTE